MDELCAAALPVVASMTGRMLGGDPIIEHVEYGWRECGQPATAVHEYTCTHGHTKRRPTCPEHAPEPGAVDCRECWDGGHECEMTVTADQITGSNGPIPTRASS